MLNTGIYHFWRLVALDKLIQSLNQMKAVVVYKLLSRIHVIQRWLGDTHTEKSNVKKKEIQNTPNNLDLYCLQCKHTQIKGYNHNLNQNN